MFRIHKAPAFFVFFVFLTAALATTAFAAETRSFGDGAGDAEATPIADILADPDAWDGREVTVEGEITGVCPKKGCWMELRDGEQTLRVKVEDDVIIFPADATGSRAKAHGTVTVQDLTREQYVGWQRHLAEELGESFDESTVGEAPYRLVQLAGLGAEIDG